MKRTWMISGCMLLAVLFIVGQAGAVEIFLWEHDNRLLSRDAVLNANITCTESVARTLTGLRMDFTREEALPPIEELNHYDVLMICLGFYCPG